MADLTPLEEKLAEVLGLAQAAQDATAKVARMEGADPFRDRLEEMGREAAEVEQRTGAHVDSLEGRKTAIREMARETKGEATEMMKTYLAGEEEALDGFEFLTMAEAGEVGHWSVVGKMNERARLPGLQELVEWMTPIQQRHLEQSFQGSVELAADEDPNEPA